MWTDIPIKGYQSLGQHQQINVKHKQEHSLGHVLCQLKMQMIMRDAAWIQVLKRGPDGWKLPYNQRQDPPNYRLGQL